MMRWEVKLQNFVISKWIKKRGLEHKGRTQKFIDSEVLRLMEPYTPFLSGTLKDSPTLQTKLGTGLIHQRQPYARRQYYENVGKGLRGKLWFGRMKADHKNDILKGAFEISKKGDG